MVSYVIVGASRGIGLEYVRQLATRPNALVFAVVRNAATSTYLASAVSGLTNVHTLEADVKDHSSLEKVAQQVSAITGGKLDVLIHNAARMDTVTVIKGLDDFANMDELDQDFIDAYRTNALGVVHSIAAFLPLLRAGATKKIVVISTAGADYQWVRMAGVANMTAYGATKAAGLMLTIKYALRLKSEGFVVAALSPGLVDTTGTIGESSSDIDQTRKAMERFVAGYKAEGLEIEVLAPAQAVQGQLKLIDELKLSDNGAFLSHNGGEWNHLL